MHGYKHGWILLKKNWVHGEDGDLFFLIDCALEIERYMRPKQGEVRNKFGAVLQKSELL